MKYGYFFWGILILAVGLFGIYFQGDFWGRGVSLGNYNESTVIQSLYLPALTAAIGLIFLSLFCLETKKPQKSIIIMFVIVTILIVISGHIGGYEAIELMKR